MVQHIILVLQGGGAKGPIQIGELAVLEDKLNKKVIDCVDVVVTTSIGAVEGSILTTGKKSASEIWKILDENLESIFTPKHFWSVPRLQFSSYVDLYNKFIGDFKFGDSKVKLVTTTVGMTNTKNHFYKSWHEKDANMKMIDMTCRSFAAPFYFGGIEDSINQEVYLDGGTGLCNLPLIEAYCEAVSLGWLQEGHSTHILALGSGNVNCDWSYKKCVSGSAILKAMKQIMRFKSSSDGGLARLQSTMYQVNTVEYLSKFISNLSLQWINWDNMPNELDKMDNWKARKIYYDKGLELGKIIDIDPFLRRV